MEQLFKYLSEHPEQIALVISLLGNWAQHRMAQVAEKRRADKDEECLKLVVESVSTVKDFGGIIRRISEELQEWRHVKENELMQRGNGKD